MASDQQQRMSKVFKKATSEKPFTMGTGAATGGGLRFPEAGRKVEGEAVRATSLPEDGGNGEAKIVTDRQTSSLNVRKSVKRQRFT